MVDLGMRTAAAHAISTFRRAVGPPMPGEGAEEFARQHSLDNVGSDGLRTI